MSRRPSAKQRVLAGCELLDREEPGWAKRIDLERFSLSSTGTCVLGQLEGDYAIGLRRFHLAAAEGSDNGFDRYNMFNPGASFDLLARHWRREIKARQARP